MTPPTLPNKSNIVGRLHRVLDLISNPERDHDQADRFLAATVLIAGAAVIAWPPGRKAPQVITRAVAIAAQVWSRRDWWLPQLPVLPHET